ncbi:DUF2059 domain-containing protein [Coralliovum pocilloporae]|uniref:DUF2059 domain-containing protein n=1 Tax=Coralliovum pocilloporae TaxID=3066369 RepID=UPI003306F657
MKKSGLGGLFAALVVAMSLQTTPTSAQQGTEIAESHLSAAKEAVLAYRATGGFSSLLELVALQTKNTFIRTNPGLEKDIVEVTDIAVKDFEDRKTQIDSNMAVLWASRFTEAELKDISAFYQTETGRKLAVEASFLLQETFRQADAVGREISNELLVKVRAEMKKRGHDL